MRQFLYLFKFVYAMWWCNRVHVWDVHEDWWLGLTLFLLIFPQTFRPHKVKNFFKWRGNSRRFFLNFVIKTPLTFYFFVYFPWCASHLWSLQRTKSKTLYTGRDKKMLRRKIWRNHLMRAGWVHHTLLRHRQAQASLEKKIVIAEVNKIITTIKKTTHIIIIGRVFLLYLSPPILYKKC